MIEHGFTRLDESNYQLFAAKSYANPGCMDINEFTDDLNRIKYIKRLLGRYQAKNELKSRLIYNHLVVLYNVFAPETACTRLLVYRLADYLDYIKPFMVMLGKWPETVEGLGLRSDTIIGSDIPLDQGVIDILRTEFKEQLVHSRIIRSMVKLADAPDEVVIKFRSKRVA